MIGGMELRNAVERALAGRAHPRVRFIVEGVEVEDLKVCIELSLLYRTESGRVCCGEPGCYIGFLGQHRFEVPYLLERELRLPSPPRVSMVVHLRHEPGYEYIDHANGGSAGPGDDYTARYDESEFRRAEAP